MQVNNDGPISFDGDMTRIRPHLLPVRRTPPFLAAYWADVDTTPRNGGAVFYRATTDQELLDRASDHITELFTQPRRTFEATELFIATWLRVGYSEIPTNLVKKLCVLIIIGSSIIRVA